MTTQIGKIQKIINCGLCLGCGLCEAIATSIKCKMILDENTGFYKPVFLKNLTHLETKAILKTCPGINLHSSKESHIWGKIIKIEEAWSSDPIIRKKASSGGVTTSLAIYLLETKKVDGILHVGSNNKNNLYNNLKISRSKDEIIQNSGSRYAPALVFDQLRIILDGSNDVYAFIGKPCDIIGIKNFIREFPVYENRITYFIAIFCAGIPSYNATKSILSQANTLEEPISIKYRGDGWPGSFEARWKNGHSIKLSYNDSWGRVLGKTLGLRCKICPDGIGLLADIAIGDSWETKNGYPVFEETDGRSFVMARTSNGIDLYLNALKDNIIKSQPFDINSLKITQRYQYDKRIYHGFRIMSIFLLYGFLLSFNKLGTFKLMLRANIFKGIKNFYGTLKRVIKIKLSKTKKQPQY